MDHHEKILQEVRQALSELRQEEKTAGQEALGRLQELRVKYLGKKGEITQMMKQMGTLPKEERPSFGQNVNSLRQKVEEAFEQWRGRAGETAQREKAGGRAHRRYAGKARGRHGRRASADQGLPPGARHF